MQPSVVKSKPIWYFAFGQEQKSSLLNEYSREHYLLYVKQVTKSADLEKYKQQSCIIQAEVKTLLEWQPMMPNIEVIFIGESFKQDELQIKNEYMQIAKCKHHSTFENYQQFRKLMHPNLIFFYGPNKQHRQGAAATIAFQSSYCYINELPKSANQIVSKIDLTQNYTFSNMFTIPSEMAVLESRFNLRVIHFKYNRNDFPNMQSFFDHEHQILKYLHGKSYFCSIDGHLTPQKMMDQIGQSLCPEITFINANNPTQKEYAQRYAHDKNTVGLSIFAIQSINKRKGLPLACTLKQKILLMNSIIYRNLSLKQIVLVDFPYFVNEIRLFEQLNRKFTRFVELDLAEEWFYSKQYTSGMYFLETQRFIRPDMNYELKEQVAKGKKYWLVTGAQGAGKTTVAKYMAEQYGMKLIQVGNYLAQLKQKLLTPEDGEELPLQKILNHFLQLFSQSQSQQYILDNFPLDPKKWVTTIGAPHVINLKVDPNELIKRQRKKNQADLTAQIGEQQLTKAQQSITQSQQLIQNLSSSNQQTITYTLDYNCTILQSQKLLSTIYQPRVFLVQSMPTLLYHNIALKHNCTFYNLAINSLEEIKQLVRKGDQRNVIIAGYQQVEGKMVSEDMYWIQKNIGKIRYVAIFNHQSKNFQQQFIHLERPIVQKPKKVLQQGQQEQQQQKPEEQEEGEPKKKVLDIYAYQWTKPVCHKNLTQWYFKLKKNVQEFYGNEKEIYKGFEQKLKRINENAGVNIYEVVRTGMIE